MTNYDVSITSTIYAYGYTIDMVEGDSLKFSLTGNFGIYGYKGTSNYPAGDTYCSYPDTFKSNTYWNVRYFYTGVGGVYYNKTYMALPAGNYFFTAGNFSNNTYRSGARITVNVASSSNIHANVGGTWKDGKVYVKVNGTWKEGKPYVNVNGTWKAGK